MRTSSWQHEIDTRHAAAQFDLGPVRRRSGRSSWWTRGSVALVAAAGVVWLAVSISGTTSHRSSRTGGSASCVGPYLSFDPRTLHRLDTLPPPELRVHRGQRLTVYGTFAAPITIPADAALGRAGLGPPSARQLVLTIGP